MASNGSEGSTARPRIGLPTYVEPARFGVWDRDAALLPHTYVSGVARAGGLPLMLPPVDAPGAARAAVDALDGLLLTGGPDIGDARERDAWERTLLDAALARDIPVLAVCRGLQLLDVARGGTLHEHVPDAVGHDGHRPVPGTYGTTRVKLEPGSKLAAILGEVLNVPCHHHQAIDRLGAGLDIVGTADDGIVEAIEDPGRRFVVGVQWHPEDSDDHRLFDAFVVAAGAP